MRKLCKSSKGVTLVELLIVLAIMGIVLMLIYSMNLFGIKTFAKGGSKADVQFEARMALDYITKEIRYSSEVEILPDSSSVPASISDNSCYIYMVDSGDSQEIKYKDKLGEKTVASFTTLNLIFSTSTNKVLQYDINGTDKQESFSIYSDVIPLNMPKGNNIFNSSGKAVKYVKGSIAVVNTLYLESIDSTINIGSSYNQSLTATGGTTPYTYSLASGTLPSGITLNTTTGVLYGTPDTFGIYLFTINVTDSSMPSLSAAGYCRVVVKDPSVTNHPPMASYVKITGIPEPGQTLAGSYNYSDIENDPQGTSIQKWYISSNQYGTGKTEITGPEITGGNCKVPAGATGNYIFYEVTPVAISGVLQGTPVLSDPVKIVMNAPPVISNLTIMVNGVKQSDAVKGQVLTPDYDYFDADGDAEGTHTYQWVSIVNGSEKTLGTGFSYTVQKEDETYNIFVRMTPADSRGSSGDTIASSSILVKSNNGGGKNN